MKFAVVLVSLVGLAVSAPQPKKIFHENFEDFIDLIDEVSGHDINHVLEHYLEFDEFVTTFTYLTTADFKTLAYEMESLPEFKAVLNFLEAHSIDITYFIDRFNGLIDQVQKTKAGGVRHTLSGRDFSSFIKDAVSEFPKTKLAALFEEKLAGDGEFKAAVEGIQSEEWKEIYGSLWANEEFLDEVKTLADNGIDLDVVIDVLLAAVFGQN